MKVLFFSINNSCSPNFERELELMSNHKEKGDDIYVLGCKGVLKSCYSNLDHKKSRCVYCKLRFNNGIELLEISKNNIFYIKDKTLTKFKNAFSNLEELKSFNLFGVNLGLGVASSLISEVADHKPDLLKYKQLINKMLNSSILIYETIVDLFKLYKFDLVYFFNGRFHDVHPVFQACKQFKIDFYTHEAAAYLDASRYTIFKNSLPHDLEGIWRDIEDVWDRGDSNRAVISKQWFENQRRGKAFIPNFLEHQRLSMLPAGFDNSKKNIVFFNSSIDEYECIPGWRSHLYTNENDFILKIIKYVGHLNKNIKFYLRMHPRLKGYNNSQIDELRRIESLNYENFKIIWPEDLEDSYALLDACDQIIVFKSTIGVEASYWGKPVILGGRAFYEKLECAYVPNNFEKLVQMIISDLPAKNGNNCLKFGYWVSKKGIKYRKYKSTGTFSGKFLGRELVSKYSAKKIHLWIVKLLEKSYLLK
ncbi:hypothetical protein KAW80_00430 [Candidatus Babeliales bacterium]|nr:hypothetical protein [Candidatus Babeliales bacterium]